MTTTTYPCQHCLQPVSAADAVLDGPSLDDAAYHLTCYFVASRAVGEPVWCGNCNQPIDTPDASVLDYNTVVHAPFCPIDE